MKLSLISPVEEWLRWLRERLLVKIEEAFASLAFADLLQHDMLNGLIPQSLDEDYIGMFILECFRSNSFHKEYFILNFNVIVSSRTLTRL